MSICVVFNLLSVIFQLFLILCGDIETNPGPVTSKSGPICNAQIHIRKQVCTCGYVFNQRHRKPRLHVVDYTKGVDFVVTGSVGEGIVLRESAETTKTMEKRATKPCEESTEAKERSEDSTNVKQASEEGLKAYKTSEESTEAIQSSEDSTEVKRAGEEGSTASQNSEEGTEATNTGEESAEPIKIGEERNVAKDKSEEQGQMNKPNTLKRVTEKGAIPKNDIDNNTKRYVDMGSLSQPSKWEERSAVVNAKRRKLYKLNPMQK